MNGHVLSWGECYSEDTDSSGASCTADPGAEAGGSSSLHSLKNLPSCIAPQTRVCGIWVLRRMRPPALFVHAQTMQSQGEMAAWVLNSQVTATAFHNSSPNLSDMVI